MSRNYQLHAMARDEAVASDDAAERAEMRALGISTIDRDAPRVSNVACEGCSQIWHPALVDECDEGWCCPDCDTFHER